MVRRFRFRQWLRLSLWILFLLLSLDLMNYYAPRSWAIAKETVMTIGQFLFAGLFMMFQFLALFWFLGRGRVYWVNPGETGYRWEDYRGNPEVNRLARHIVTLLQGVKEFKSMGGEAIRGLLLVGPPGTGKSYLAQVIANEAGVPFCYASAPSFQNMFFGVSNLKVMNLYRKARKQAMEYGACIIFIDEIDAIGGSRKGGGGGSLFGAGLGLLNELLLQMDPPNIDNQWHHKLLRELGIRQRKAERPIVLTIGATNLAEILDTALLRPGRFDRQIVIDVPDQDGRADVLRYYLQKVKVESALDVDRMAVDTIGYTPAQLKHIVNESVVIAHQEGAGVVTYQHFRRAMEIYEWGLRQPIRSFAEAERKRVAYHEAGHAVVQHLKKPQDRLWKVTIIRHGSALGLSATKPKTERYHQSREDLEVELQVCLAGRAAEELFLGEQLGGATDDLRKATQIASFYLGAAGMGGDLYSWAVTGALEGTRSLRPKINRLLTTQMEQVKVLLEEHRDFASAIAEALLRHDELTGDEVEAIYQSLHGPTAVS